MGVALLCVGCDEQQVLYRTQSKEQIPPVPEGVESAVSAAPAATIPTQPAPVATSLPSPKATSWDPIVATEPLTPSTFQSVRVELPTRYELSDRQMPMRLGTWAIPGSGGSEAGELVLYYFGAGQGGGVEENVKRWVGQFRGASSGESPLVRFESGSRDNLTITRATIEGTWSAPAMGPGAPAQPARPEYALDALIVEGGPGGTLFFRFTGPVALIRNEDAAIRAVAGSMTVAAP